MMKVLKRRVLEFDELVMKNYYAGLIDKGFEANFVGRDYRVAYSLLVGKEVGEPIAITFKAGMPEGV